MKFFATIVFALASVAAAAPGVQPGNEPEGLVPKVISFHPALPSLLLPIFQIWGDLRSIPMRDC